MQRLPLTCELGSMCREFGRGMTRDKNDTW